MGSVILNKLECGIVAISRPFFNMKVLCHVVRSSNMFVTVAAFFAYQVNNVNSLRATPPRTIANPISNRDMMRAFFLPSSLTKAEIVATHGT